MRIEQGYVTADQAGFLQLFYPCKHGEDEKNTARASSTLVIRALSCNSDNIFQSVVSTEMLGILSGSSPKKQNVMKIHVERRWI